MAEPENFEDDLFADLYADDDAAQKTTSATTELKPEPVANAEVKFEESAPEKTRTEDGDEQMYTGEDADDEIDFNLGNGNSYSTPPTHEAHGPGIKEDG